MFAGRHFTSLLNVRPRSFSPDPGRPGRRTVTSSRPNWIKSTSAEARPFEMYYVPDVFNSISRTSASREIVQTVRPARQIVPFFFFLRTIAAFFCAPVRCSRHVAFVCFTQLRRQINGFRKRTATNVIGPVEEVHYLSNSDVASCVRETIRNDSTEPNATNPIEVLCTADVSNIGKLSRFSPVGRLLCLTIFVFLRAFKGDGDIASALSSNAYGLRRVTV